MNYSFDVFQKAVAQMALAHNCKPDFFRCKRKKRRKELKGQSNRAYRLHTCQILAV
jgi:hypothetical protein